MSSVNKVILVGNLGRDPEVRYTNDGAKIVNLNVATSERWKGRDGQPQERTEWHKVVIFNERLADVAEKYLEKGRKVYLEGQLQTRKWTGQDGKDNYTTEVVLQRFRGELVLLGGRDDGQSERPARQERPKQSMLHKRGHREAEPKGNDFDDLDDEIPF